jgi:hypothetical protein
MAALQPAESRAEAALSYRAPAGCPGEADFVAAVKARGADVEQEKTRVRLDVAIDEASGRFYGSLRVEREGVPSEPRSVHGDTCAEVVDALAVVSALAAREAPANAPSPAMAEEAKTAAPPLKPPEPAPKEDPRPPLKARASFPTPFHPGDRVMDVDAGKVRLESVTSVTALGGVAFGVVPGVPMPRIDLQLERANFVTLPNDDSILTGPIWRVRLSLLAESEYRAGNSTTQVGGQSVGAGLYYAPIYDAGGLELLFGGELGVGILGVRTRDAPGARTHDKNVGTGTLGLAAEATYNFGRHFHLTFKGGLDATTSALTAEREDGRRIFESSWASGYGMLGLGGHW